MLYYARLCGGRYKKQAVDCSKVTFILMDKSKIGIESFVNFAKVESVTLITDQLTEMDKKKIPKKQI